MSFSIFFWIVSALHSSVGISLTLSRSLMLVGTRSVPIHRHTTGSPSSACRLCVGLCEAVHVSGITRHVFFCFRLLFFSMSERVSASR